MMVPLRLNMNSLLRERFPRGANRLAALGVPRCRPICGRPSCTRNWPKSGQNLPSAMGNRSPALAVNPAGTGGSKDSHMYRVAAAVNCSLGPSTWAAALVVVAGWIAGALFVANHLASTPQPLLPQKALAVSELSQTSNRAAKAAREPFTQSRLAPDPSVLSAPSQAPQDGASLRDPPQDEAAPRNTSQDDAA